MAYTANELNIAGQSFSAQGRCFSTETRPKTFAPGTGTLAILTPVTYNTSLNQWVVWDSTDATNQVSTVTVTATASTYTLSLLSETTAGINYNANKDTIQAALEAMGAVQPGDVVVTGTGPFTLTFGGNLAGQAITVTASGASIAEVTAGSAGAGRSSIKGLVWPDAIVLSGDTANAVLGNVMLAGEVHFDDIVVPTGESSGTLAAALRTQARDINISVTGLTQVR